MSDFLKNLAKNEAKSISERLSSETKRELYKIFQKEEVLKDVEALYDTYEETEVLSEDKKAEILNNAANRYVYDGDYDDTNLSYMDNLRSLLTEELEKYLDKDIDL